MSANRFVPASLTTVCALWATRNFWFPGRYLTPFDAYTYSGPNLEVTTEAARSWRLALWNDAVFGGVTHLGNPQAGTLYPPRLIGLMIETNRAMGVLVALHVLVLGLGMVALTRRLGLGAAATTLAGVASVFGGAVLTKATQFEQILVLAWTPWSLVALLAVVTSARPWRSVAGLAAVTAAVSMAGHPQLVYVTGCLALAGLLGFLLTAGTWSRVVHVALGVGLGVAIAAPQLVAALVATSESAVADGRPLADLRVPGHVLEPDLVAGALLGTVLDRDAAVVAGGFELVAFVGVGVALLAAIGFVDALRRPERRWWAACFALAGLVALVWSQGPDSLWFRGAFRLLPGFDLGRVSGRWMVVVALVAVVLAAAGLDAVVRRPSASHVITAVATAAIGGIAAAVGRQEAVIVAGWALTAALILGSLAVVAATVGRGRVGALGVLGAVVALELTLLAARSFPASGAVDDPFTTWHTATTDWLRQHDDGLVVALTDDLQPPEYAVPGLRPNANVLHGIRSIDGYDGGVQVTRRWAEALRRFQPNPAVDFPLRDALVAPLDQAQLARLGVRYVLIDSQRPTGDLVPGWLGPVVEDDRFAVFENPAYVGEAIAWPSARAIESGLAADVLRERVNQLDATALVDGMTGFECSSGATCEVTAVELERLTPERLVLTTDLDRRSVVSVAQQFAPGWHATLDGEDVALTEVDGLFLGVDVPPGRHEIELTYRPSWLTTTLVLSGLAVVATIALAVFGGRRSVRPPSDTAP